MPKLVAAGVVNIFNLPNLQSIFFDSLEELRLRTEGTSLRIGGVPHVSAIEFPRLVRAGSGVSLFGVNGRIAKFPRLEQAGQISVGGSGFHELVFPELSGRTSISIEGCPELVRVSFPKATELHNLTLTSNPSLKTVHLTATARILGRDNGSGINLDFEEETVQFEFGPIRRIDGRLFIRGNNGPDLSWLPAIESVGQEVNVALDGAILDGLDSLREVGTDLIVSGGPQVGSYGSIREIRLENLERVGGNIEIHAGALGRLSMPHLESTGGLVFDVIPGVRASTVPFDLAMLREIDGDVILIASRLPDTSSAAPASLGLTRLDHVGGSLIVQETRGASISLPTLQSIGADLLVVENPDLVSLALPRLETVGASITISENRNLPSCQAQALVESLAGSIGGTVTISGNNPADLCEGP
jgi:hypothetical protein